MSNLRNPGLGAAEIDAMCGCVLAAAEVQDRLDSFALIGRDYPYHNTIEAMERLGLHEHEMPEYRRLKDRGFAPIEAANVLIRSRRSEA